MINDRSNTKLDHRDIDPSTGLPRLPEGDRWYVSEEIHYFSHSMFIKVSWQTADVYEDRRWWGLAKPLVYTDWERVQSSSFLKTEGVTKENILLTAIDVVDAHNLKIEGKRLLGAYPPKTLQKETS